MIASATLLPPFGETAALGPNIVSDLFINKASVYVPASTSIAYPLNVVPALIAACIVACEETRVVRVLSVYTLTGNTGTAVLIFCTTARVDPPVTENVNVL